MFWRNIAGQVGAKYAVYLTAYRSCRLCEDETSHDIGYDIVPAFGLQPNFTPIKRGPLVTELTADDATLLAA